MASSVSFRTYQMRRVKKLSVSFDKSNHDRQSLSPSVKNRNSRANAERYGVHLHSVADYAATFR